MKRHLVLVYVLCICALVLTPESLNAQRKAWYNPYADTTYFTRVDGSASGSNIATVTARGIALYDYNAQQIVQQVEFDSVYRKFVSSGGSCVDVFLDTAKQRVCLFMLSGDPSNKYVYFYCYTLKDSTWAVDTTMRYFNTSRAATYTIDHNNRTVLLNSEGYEIDSQPAAWSYSVGAAYLPEQDRFVQVPPVGRTAYSRGVNILYYRPDLELFACYEYTNFMQISGHSHGDYFRGMYLYSAKTKSYPNNLPNDRFYDFSDDGKYILSSSGLLETRRMLALRPAPAGTLLSPRMIVHGDSLRHQILLYDIELARDIKVLESSTDIIQNFFVTFDRKHIVAVTKDSVLLIGLPTSYAAPDVVPRFNCSASVLQVGDILSLTNLCYPSQAGAYTWDFGDGTTDTSESTTHYYRKAGSYVVHLSVRTPNGDVIMSDDACTITVQAPSTVIGYERCGLGPIQQLNYSSGRHCFLATNRSARLYSVSEQDANSAVLLSSLDTTALASAYCTSIEGSTLYGLQTRRRDTTMICPYDISKSAPHHLSSNTILHLDAQSTKPQIDVTTHIYDSFYTGWYEPYLYKTQVYEQLALSPQAQLSANGKWALINTCYSINSYWSVSGTYTSQDKSGRTALISGDTYRINTTTKKVSFQVEQASVDITNNDTRRHSYFYDYTSHGVYDLSIDPSSTRYFSAENSDMILSPASSHIVERDLESGAVLRSIADSTQCVRYLNDGSGFITQNAVYKNDGTLVRALSMGNPRHIEVLKNKHHIVVMGSDSTLASIFNIVTNSFTQRYVVKGKAPSCMAVSDDSKTLAIGTYEGSVVLFSLPDFATDDVADDNLSEQLPTLQFSIGPMPLQSFVSINTSRAAEFRIMDLQGRERQRIQCAAGENRMSVDELSNGFYIIECCSEASIAPQRLVVMH